MLRFGLWPHELRKAGPKDEMRNPWLNAYLVIPTSFAYQTVSGEHHHVLLCTACGYSPKQSLSNTSYGMAFHGEV